MWRSDATSLFRGSAAFARAPRQVKKRGSWVRVDFQTKNLRPGQSKYHRMVPVKRPTSCFDDGRGRANPKKRSTSQR